MSDLIEGRQPVLEALKAERPINKIQFAENIGRNDAILRIIDLAKQHSVRIEYVKRSSLDQLCSGRNHQGVIALTAAHEYAELDDLLAAASKKNELPFLVLLDGLEDPQNLGAIIRTADAAGAHGVVITKHRAVGLTAVVAKTSAGAIEHVPVARVNNLNDCIRELKEKRVWVFGLDEKGETNISKADFKLPLALVLGKEGAGLSRLVKENCEMLVSIPIKGKVNSLNASVAAAVAMYEVVRQRQNLV
ncbi:MAG: RNA methyltransferase [Candidatus Saganbacteria bacterium]|uniref:RNA methyltransferase n=1 Tax=Candidatus Saganbacteria bacterium TaxID=2575572 RepID=A0A833NZU1_UNCSA|nr:MAG: RNA methyltransferase [Candidatus Saganbacteria bacterium]